MDIYTKKMNEFLSFLFDKTRVKKEQFKIILTQHDCGTIPWKGYVIVGNPHLYLKSLNKLWKILSGVVMLET